jgi:hypothetical protein
MTEEQWSMLLMFANGYVCGFFTWVAINAYRRIKKENEKSRDSV